MNKIEIVTKQLLRYEEIAKEMEGGTFTANPKVYIQYNEACSDISGKPEFAYGTLNEKEQVISITREQMFELLLELHMARIERKHQRLIPTLARFCALSQLKNPFLEDIIEDEHGITNASHILNECLIDFLSYCHHDWFQDLFVYYNGTKNTVSKFSANNSKNYFDIQFSHTYNRVLEQSDLIPYSIRYKIATHLYNRLKTMIDYETSDEYSQS